MVRGLLLIVVATDAELPLVAVGEVVVSGVGKSAAAVATALRLAAGGVDGVVSFGVAGAYPAARLTVGDVVVATEVALLDEGLETGGAFRPFARPAMPVPGAEWSATDPVLRSALSTAGHAFGVVAGRIATVSACAGSERLAREREASGAVAEGMEGAAVALAAARYGLPFVEVRGIANPCGPREHAPFDLATAVRNASAVLAGLGRTRGPVTP